MTFDPNFKVMTFFEVKYRNNGASWRQSYYCTMGNYTKHMEWYYVWWPWLTYKRVACQAVCAIERTSRPPVCSLYRLLRQQAACRQPAAGGSTKRSAGRQPWNWTHLSPDPWLQAQTLQPIGVVGPVIIHVNGLAIWLGFVHMLPAELLWTSP